MSQMGKPCNHGSKAGKGASHKALADRWVKRRKCRAWWHSLPEAEQYSLHCKQLDAHPGSKPSFDGIVYAESSMKPTLEQAPSADDIQPFRDDPQRAQSFYP